VDKGTGQHSAVLLTGERALGRSPPLFPFSAAWPFLQKQEPKPTHGFKPPRAKAHQAGVCLDRAWKGTNRLASPKKATCP